MIPEEGKFYKIKYIDPFTSDASYEGIGRYTGDMEEDSEEEDLSKGILYVFDSLERDQAFFSDAYFAEEDIIEEVNITESDE